MRKVGGHDSANAGREHGVKRPGGPRRTLAPQKVAVAKARTMELAPLCVPVEIASVQGESRCFRLALGIDHTGLRLRSPLPEELHRRPLRIRLTLPPPTEELARLFADEWDGNLRLVARAASEVVAPNTANEKRLWRLLIFDKPEAAMREKLQRYIELRTDAA